MSGLTNPAAAAQEQDDDAMSLSMEDEDEQEDDSDEYDGAAIDIRGLVGKGKAKRANEGKSGESPPQKAQKT